MWHETNLFYSLELYSNKKSFEFGADLSKNLWILAHFSELTIIKRHFTYKHQRGAWDWDNPKYPVRRLRKKFKNTLELLNYLRNKPYIFLDFSFEFDNGWRIEHNIFTKYHTNSEAERDELIHRLNAITGLPPIDLSTIRVNFSYYRNAEGVFERHRVDAMDDLENPDDYWSKEQLDEWRKRVHEVQRSMQPESEEDNEHVTLPPLELPPEMNRNLFSDTDDSEESPF